MMKPRRRTGRKGFPGNPVKPRSPAEVEAAICTTRAELTKRYEDHFLAEHLKAKSHHGMASTPHRVAQCRKLAREYAEHYVSHRERTLLELAHVGILQGMLKAVRTKKSRLPHSARN
jgi:hypothetical protein